MQEPQSDLSPRPRPRPRPIFSTAPPPGTQVFIDIATDHLAARAVESVRRYLSDQGLDGNSAGEIVIEFKGDFSAVIPFPRIGPPGQDSVDSGGHEQSA